MKFLLRKTSFLAISLLIIANFLFGNFVLSKGIEISGKDIERIKAGLDVVQLFANIAISDEKVKTALNTGVKGGKSGTDITYGLLVLTAMNETDLIDMVVSQRYKQEATAYFNQIIDERTSLTSHWKGVGYDLPRVVRGNVASPMVGLTLNSFSITDKVISIFTAFNVIRQEKIYDGLWYYFSLRRENKESHQVAWEDAKILIGWAVGKTELAGFYREKSRKGERDELESQFAELWDRWGPYTDRFGVVDSAKKQFKEEIGKVVLEAVEQQALVEKEKEPPLIEKVIVYFADKAYEIFTVAWDTIKSTVSQVNLPGGAGVGQQVFEVVPMSEAERAEIVQRSDLGTAEDENNIEDEEVKQPPQRPPTPEELAELQRQVDEAARMVEALNLQVRALVDAQEDRDEEVEEEEELEELEEEKEESAKQTAICPVNINTASQQELQAITGVGPVISQRIIEARPFSSLNELETKVKGIGPKTLQKIINQGCAFAAGFIASGGGGGAVSAQTTQAQEQAEAQEQVQEQETEPAQNLLANEFFEEWINPPKYWDMGEHTSDAQKSSQALRGESSLNIKHSFVGLRNIEQHLASTTADLGNPEKAYGEIRVKGTGYIRIGIKAGQTNYSHSAWSKLDGNDWTKTTFERVAADTENIWQFRIQTSRRQNAHASSTNPHEFSQIDLQIGAAWLGTAQPPATWPMGEPPDAVVDFALDTQNSYSNQASLTWATSTDSDTLSENLSYKIYYSKAGELTESNLDDAGTQTATTTQATTTVSSLNYNSTYYFGIKAFDPENNSSTLATTTPYKTATLATIATGFPSNLSIANNGRKLAKTSNGDLYTVYYRDNKIFLSKSTDEGKNWSEIPATPDETSEQINPSIAIDSQNNLHIAWQGKVGTSTVYQIRYRKYNGSSFSAIETLTEDENWNQEIPVAAVNSQDNVHLVWVDNKMETGPQGDISWRPQILYQSFTSQWETATSTGSSIGSSIFSLALAVDSQNNLHLVWQGTVTSGPSWSYTTRYRKKSASGWEEKELKLGEQVGDFSSLSIDNQDNLHIVWHSIGSGEGGQQRSNINYLEYIASTDSWSDIEVLHFSDRSQQPVIASPSISLDSQDNLYLIWKRSYEKISLIEFSNSWQSVKSLGLGGNDSYAFTNLLWPYQPQSGYAFIFYEGTDLKFYGSNDLTWE